MCARIIRRLGRRGRMPTMTIVAQKAKTAEPARRILEKVEIDYYNDEVNHVMLKTGLHRRLHSNFTMLG